jgi:hypothetical protein
VPVLACHTVVTLSQYGGLVTMQSADPAAIDASTKRASPANMVHGSPSGRGSGSGFM